MEHIPPPTSGTPFLPLCVNLFVRCRRTGISVNGRVEKTSQPVEKVLVELGRKETSATSQPISQRGRRKRTLAINNKYEFLKCLLIKRQKTHFCLLIRENSSSAASLTCLRVPHANRNATAMLSSSFLHRLCLLAGSSSQSPGGARATASAGKGRRPHPRFCSKRLRFWPDAIIRASQLTGQSRRRRKRPIPCHCLPSANNGSTQTLRLFRAFW